MNFKTLFRFFQLLTLALALPLLSQSSFARSRPQPTPVPTPTPVPRFWGTALPEPPQQKSPWTPDASLPANFVSATQTLFDQGLADPRGGDYRNIEVVASSTSGNTHIHGWVLPGSDSQKFAVCWNGWVYPLISVGSPADLQSDVAELLKQPHTSNMRRNSRFRIRRIDDKNIPPAEGSLSPSEKGFSLIKACLLARLGENDLANSVWTSWLKDMDADGGNAESLRDPYLALTGDWMESLFARAACAHTRADDRLVLLDAQTLTALQPSVEAEASRRGFIKDRDSHNFPRLSFLGWVVGLLNDAKQRLGQLPSPALPVSVASPKAQQVAALIKDLDEVQASIGNPTGIDWSGDKHVEALTKMGEDAIEPLIDAYVSDKRLTRHSPLTMYDSWEFLYIEQIEHSLLIGLLRTDAFQKGQDSYNYERKYPTGQEHVDQIRAYWKEYGVMSPPERWYQILKDDQWGSDAWRQAAANIVTPSNISIAPTNAGGTSMSIRGLRRGEKPQLRGEVLRNKTNPSVTELLALRADDIGKIEEVTSADIESKERACEVALDLSIWDSQAAVPALQLATGRYRATLAKDSHSTSDSSNQSLMLRLFLARIRGGDSTAWPDYKIWAGQHKPDEHDIFFRDEDNLAALWQDPNNKTLQIAGEWLLDDKSSPLWDQVKDGHLVEDSFFWTGYIWKAPSFKAYVLNQLNDTTVAGTLHYHKSPRGKDEWSVQFNGHSSSFPVEPGTPQPNSVTPTPIRVCDYYAWLLWYNTGELNKEDHFKKAPRFELYWPQKKRDATLPKSAEFVRKFRRL